MMDHQSGKKSILDLSRVELVNVETGVTKVVIAFADFRVIRNR
jgi:hypothetical protein